MGGNILSNGRKQPFQWAETTLPLSGNQKKNGKNNLFSQQSSNNLSLLFLTQNSRFTVLSYFTIH